MTMPRTAATIAPETLHPSLWLASQLAHSTTRCIDTGYAALSAQLPGGGWPTGTLIDLLQQQPGIGELRLLHPALASLGSRPIVLLAPPHPPQAVALAAMGLPPSQLVWVRSGAKSGDTLFCMLRPLTSAQDSSPAPLRLSLRPAV